jgi:hypothetical protein
MDTNGVIETIGICLFLVALWAMGIHSWVAGKRLDKLFEKVEQMRDDFFK